MLLTVAVPAKSASMRRVAQVYRGILLLEAIACGNNQSLTFAIMVFGALFWDAREGGASLATSSVGELTDKLDGKLASVVSVVVVVLVVTVVEEPLEQPAKAENITRLVMSRP